MTRVYWDTMIFAYWLEAHPQFGPRVAAIAAGMQDRGDRICASHWSLCELLVHPCGRADQPRMAAMQTYFQSAALELLPLTANVAPKFAEIRAGFRIGSADALHLAIAATAGVGLFLTHDRRLARAKIAGIEFIVSLDTDLY